MLNREQAQAQLKAYQVESWEVDRRRELSKLPETVSMCGEALLGLSSNPYEDVSRAIAEIEGWPKERRLQLFEVAFPQIGKWVDQTYDLLLTLPYPSGYCRRSFRSSKVSHYSRRRQEWLRSILQLTRGYAQPLDWYAAWAPHLGYRSNALGLLFAGAINEECELGNRVFDILCESARGEHETGGMGRHVVRSLLVASRPEGWQLIENLLVAAQRQEGLRQVILETVDEAHPEAFARMLRVVVEQDLTRFSATIRAADTWFGLGFDVEQRRWVQSSIEQVLLLFEQPDQVQIALESDDPYQVFLALWRLAFDDAMAAIAAATHLLSDARAEHRFVAVYLLRQLNVLEADEAIASALADPHLRIAAEAFQGMSFRDYVNTQSDIFEQLETFLDRFPSKETTLEPLVWPWMTTTVARSQIGRALLQTVGDRPVTRLLPYVSILDSYLKIDLARRLVKAQPWEPSVREAVFDLVGDRTAHVRESVLRSLQEQYTPAPEEAPMLESFLTRKAADLRRGVLSLLLKQSDADALVSAERLLETTKAPQRLAGLELLEQLQRAGRVDGRDLAEQYAQQRPKRTASEQELLDKLLAAEQEIPTLEDALGLAPVGARSRAVAPRHPSSPVFLTTTATRRLLESLSNLLEAHRTTPVTVQTYDGERTQLLGNIRWLPGYKPQRSRVENLAAFPLGQLWQQWWEDRPDELRDLDGLELDRAIVAFSDRREMRSHSMFSVEGESPKWVNNFYAAWFASSEGLCDQTYSVLCWLKQMNPQSENIDFLLDAAEFTLSEIAEVSQVPAYEWRESGLEAWLNAARYSRSFPDGWKDNQVARLWQLLRWREQPSHSVLPRWQMVQGSYGPQIQQAEPDTGEVRQMQPELKEVLAAFEAGVATEADVFTRLVGIQTMGTQLGNRQFRELKDLTGRKPHALIQGTPQLEDMVDRCRDHILQIELRRGELPTAATGPALSLSSITGIPTLLKLLQNFGTERFARGWLRDSQSKASVFSHLFRVSFPEPDDTPESFARQVKATEISQQRLVELAVYAPQWARYVEQALGWPDLAEAVWWFHAHTKDKAWQVSQEIRELWSAQIAELTPLSSQNLIDGAVDVAWFGRIYQKLSAKRWQELDEAAKYASGGGGHKRAQLFADTMTGKTDRTALITRIQQKRHQDAVRALGLLPLAKGKQTQTDLLERYEVIQEFLRTSRKFGAQRKASEKLAAQIGMENLARTAAYPDPQRLEWAMEQAAIADLAAGPVTVSVDEVAISLSITTTGQPEISVVKKGKSLKSVPAKLRKNAAIKELQTRKQDLTRQASRMRKSLEQSMCRGDEFSGAELKLLLTHPILRPILNQLLFTDGEVFGYLIEGAIAHHDQTQTQLTDTMRLRLAHPVDLAHSGEWHRWQQHCFTTEQVQPFKQIFRELYVPTTAEQQGQSQGSVRYAGHQVNPRQSVALLGARGWIVHPYEGVRQTFHAEDLLVWIEFEGGWFTPTEVEGYTLDQVHFACRRTYKTVPITAVPPRLFSEVMRDLDLVVSVAHQGGVDPEASASTVEMRASLLRETTRLLKIENVHLQEPYALIEGALGNYTLHLGSATVHRQPGGALCIIPVHAQHRGRLFLPFADDDPKTAEVIAKALLLAKDNKIQDPTILEQLR